MVSPAGLPLQVCPYASFADGWADAVVVTGARWNPCGHALLHSRGDYFHVASVYGPPLHLTQFAYENYLRVEQKMELKRFHWRLPIPKGAQNKLSELVAKPWLWGVLPHNCVAFVEDVLRAGGVTSHLWSNCPEWEDFSLSRK